MYNKSDPMQLDNLVREWEDLHTERDALLREQTAFQKRHYLLEAAREEQPKAQWAEQNRSHQNRSHQTS